MTRWIRWSGSSTYERRWDSCFSDFVWRVGSICTQQLQRHTRPGLNLTLHSKWTILRNNWGSQQTSCIQSPFEGENWSGIASFWSKNRLRKTKMKTLHRKSPHKIEMDEINAVSGSSWWLIPDFAGFVSSIYQFIKESFHISVVLYIWSAIFEPKVVDLVAVSAVDLEKYFVNNDNEDLAKPLLQTKRSPRTLSERCLYSISEVLQEVIAICNVKPSKGTAFCRNH